MGMGIRAHEQKHQRHQEVYDAADETTSPSLAALYLYGDVLESVVSRVPTADLAATARVSREWRRAVRAALRRRPRRLPWLVVHLHGRRRRTAAYDPYSGTWLTMTAPRHATPAHVRLVRGAGGDRVCSLSLTGLAVTGDPLATSTWRAMKAPHVWRVDPVLAAVGDHVVALGGACDLALGDGEDAAAVEVHDGGDADGNWTSCEPMPAAFRQSAAATWLSAAATERRVYVIERSSGWTSWFDPAKRRWGPTRRLQPDIGVTTWGVAAGGSGERLVLVGAMREGEKGVVVKTWEVEGDTLELAVGCCDAAVGEMMPREMAERLFPHDEDEEDEEEMALSIGMCGNASGGYVYNAAEPANGAVLYELSPATTEEKRKERGRIVERWEWVPGPPAMKADPFSHAIFACSPVGLDELELACSGEH